MERECEKGKVEVKAFFVLHRDNSRRLCEIRWDFEQLPPERRMKEEQRLFLQLGPSLLAANVWLTILGADSGYSFGTIFEYAKQGLKIIARDLSLEVIRQML